MYVRYENDTSLYRMSERHGSRHYVVLMRSDHVNYRTSVLHTENTRIRRPSNLSSSS